MSTLCSEATYLLAWRTQISNSRPIVAKRKRQQECGGMAPGPETDDALPPAEPVATSTKICIDCGQSFEALLNNIGRPSKRKFCDACLNFQRCEKRAA
jgi:hypothetical protein